MAIADTEVLELTATAMISSPGVVPVVPAARRLPQTDVGAWASVDLAPAVAAVAGSIMPGTAGGAVADSIIPKTVVEAVAASMIPKTFNVDSVTATAYDNTAIPSA